LDLEAAPSEPMVAYTLRNSSGLDVTSLAVQVFDATHPIALQASKT
jgi:hypothetical protein